MNHRVGTLFRTVHRCQSGGSVRFRVKSLEQHEKIYFGGHVISSSDLKQKPDFIKAAKFDNPVLELEPYIKEPLLRPDEKYFEPTRDIKEYVHQLFHPVSRGGSPGFYLQAKTVNPSLLHDFKRPEGQTRTIDFYNVQDVLTLVDTPGYDENQPDTYAKVVGAYLNRKLNLKCIFLIMNPAKKGKEMFSNHDLSIIQKLEALQIPYCLVITKVDLFTRSQRLRTLVDVLRLRQEFETEHCFPQPFFVSNLTEEGIGFLQSFIVSLCGKPKATNETGFQSYGYVGEGDGYEDDEFESLATCVEKDFDYFDRNQVRIRMSRNQVGRPNAAPHEYKRNDHMTNCPRTKKTIHNYYDFK